MAKSLNKVLLIGNLTRDPELRYTPQGTAVATFGIATNRQWKTDSGEMKDDVEFHKIVAWDKLAEICSKMLKKGSRTYVEGRLQTRNWEGQDGVKKTTTEIVITDMLMLDGRRPSDEVSAPVDLADTDPNQDVKQKAEPVVKEVKSKKKADAKIDTSADVTDEDIPF